MLQGTVDKDSGAFYITKMCKVSVARGLSGNPAQNIKYCIEHLPPFKRRHNTW